MKHGQNPRRGRSRGNGKRNPSNRNQTYDSNGPEGKVRGTPQQIHDKYLSLARDAASAGEHIAAEGFFQFAEHYYRILNTDQQNRLRAEQQQQQDSDDESDASGDDGDGDNQPGGNGGEAAASNDGEQGRRGRGNGRRRNVGGQERQADDNAGGSGDVRDGDVSESADASRDDDKDTVADVAQDAGTDGSKTPEPSVTA